MLDEKQIPEGQSSKLCLVSLKRTTSDWTWQQIKSAMIVFGYISFVPSEKRIQFHRKRNFSLNHMMPRKKQELTR